MSHIDSHRCADELFNFAESFQKFKCSVLFDEDKEEEQDSDLDSGSESETEDHEEEADSESSDDGTAEEPKDKDKRSFLEALRILLNPDYHLVDTFPTLCKVYAIAVAIPISSATAERSFSALIYRVYKKKGNRTLARYCIRITMRMNEIFSHSERSCF
jgi:hypothetical protein